SDRRDEQHLQHHGWLGGPGRVYDEPEQFHGRDGVRDAAGGDGAGRRRQHRDEQHGVDCGGDRHQSEQRHAQWHGDGERVERRRHLQWPVDRQIGDRLYVDGDEHGPDRRDQQQLQHHRRVGGESRLHDKSEQYGRRRGIWDAAGGDGGGRRRQHRDEQHGVYGGGDRHQSEQRHVERDGHGQRRQRCRDLQRPVDQQVRNGLYADGIEYGSDRRDEQHLQHHGWLGGPGRVYDEPEQFHGRDGV